MNIEFKIRKYFNVFKREILLKRQSLIFKRSKSLNVLKIDISTVLTQNQKYYILHLVKC